MSTIVVNLFAVLFWAISAVLWWISSTPPGATPESLAVEAYYSKWAAVAAGIAALLQVISVLMGTWRARGR